MNLGLDSLAFFHFLRPMWIGLIPVALFSWWNVRSRATVRPRPPLGLAPHLAAALVVGGEDGKRLLAIDGVVLTLILASLAAAGPTWTRAPSPFVTQTAPLAVVLATTQSMLAVDVAPNRLERAKHKLLDLLELRSGARTALIAYAGTAHRVVPLSEDPEVLKPFIEGLLPSVMPVEGRNATAALALAKESLEAEFVPGAILFILDEFDSADVAAFSRHAEEGGPGVVFLALASSKATLERLERVPGSSVVSFTSDAADVRQVERKIASVFRAALMKDDRQEWEDRGWVLAWPAALWTLVHFRRGWTIGLGAVLALGIGSLAPAPAHANGFEEIIERELFTPDQRGRLAFEAGRYDEAAAIFEDPVWKGFSLYSNGNYAEAASSFARVASADAAFAEAMARMRAGEYRLGITSFGVALERDSNHQAAARNREIALAILAYLERTRADSDTRGGSEGADKIVFEENMEGGEDQTLNEKDRLKMESAEQWMRTVETQMGDFLRLRFALEALERDR